MTSDLVRRAALVLSTTPPFPRDYGNRNRVHQTVDFLERLGYSVSFLLYPFDEEWVAGVPDYYRELVRRFDYFAVIPNQIRLHALAAGTHHAIDEWWDENIARHLEWLFRRKRFDVFLVNYTFLSRAFTLAPGDCVRLLDTHDQFSGRREMLEGHGVAPEFFYTTPEQEKIAFDRAHGVIAIKAAEAKFIRSLTRASVFCVPYYDDRPAGARPRAEAAPAEFDHDRPLRLGFIGAQNAVNFVNLNRFLDRFDRWMRLYDLPVVLRVAGHVCRRIERDRPYVEKLGRVEDVSEFYDGVDAVVAPLEFSTGIKIKVGEALARGLPVFATQNAFDGFSASHPAQNAASFDDLAEAITAVACNETPLQPIARAGERSARAAARAQARGFAALAEWLRDRARRIVFVTRAPFWRRSTLHEEQISQAIEFASQIGRVIVISTADGRVLADRVHGMFDAAELAADAVPAALGEIDRACLISDLLVAEFDDEARLAGVAPRARLWTLRGQSHAAEAEGLELRARDGAAGRAGSPLRYLPSAVTRNLRASHVAIFLRLRPSDWDLCVAAYVRAAAGERGLTTETVEGAGDGFADDPAFYTRICGVAAERRVFLGAGPAHAWALQIARYHDGVSCLIATPEFVAPQAERLADRPSLTQSIDAFLDGGDSAGTVGGPDSGWGRFWDLAKGG